MANREHQPNLMKDDSTSSKKESSKIATHYSSYLTILFERRDYPKLNKWKSSSLLRRLETRTPIRGAMIG